MIKLNFTTPFLKPRDIKGMTSAPCRQRQAELIGASQHSSTAQITPALRQAGADVAPHGTFGPLSLQQCGNRL